MHDEYSVVEQNIIIGDRKKITVTGIKSVDSFDDTMISATTVTDTVLNIEGSDLQIKDVNLDKLQFEASGNITGLYYIESASGSKKSIFSYLKRS